MIIKYLKSKEIEKGGYQFIQITGEKADGTTYNKDFPQWDSEMVAALDNFAPGEFLELSYKSDKYKNLKGIKGATGFDVQKDAPKNPSKKRSGGSSEDFGNTRGMDTNRSAAMYLAKDIVEKSVGKKAIPIKDYTHMIIATANTLLMYLTEGRDLVKEEMVGDGLAVPEIEIDTEEE